MTKDNWHEIKNWRDLPEMAGYEVMVSAVNPFGQRSDFPAFQGYGDFKWYTNDSTKMQDAKSGNNAVNECWKITHWTEMPRYPAKVVLRRVDTNRKTSEKYECTHCGGICYFPHHKHWTIGYKFCPQCGEEVTGYE
jgi:predicted RNA-binding Zn-ribbon protein involved in translation (DUF1610 family)